MPRRPLDQYETPPHYVEPLLQHIGPLGGLSVYEPCVGQGHIAKYLTMAGNLCTNDLDPQCEATIHEDARTERAWPISTIDRRTPTTSASTGRSPTRPSATSC